jgi:predicted nucleic acid-binding protein
VKLVVPEPGSAEAIDAWNHADRVVSSLVLYPEARAAIGRAHRSHRLDDRAVRVARSAVDRLWRDVDRIELTQRLAREAGRLAELYALRAYDAVHLASLESVEGRETVLASADGAFLNAALAQGFATFAPLDVD